MTPKKKTPAKRGRKAIEADQRLEQLTIRLPPKLKLGLDLLARAQHRSLSQAIEWALLVGLNSYRVNNEWESVAALLDRAWEKTDPFDRLYEIYNAAPDLLSFEDRAGCEVVDRSYEAEMANEYQGVYRILPNATTDKERIANGEKTTELQAQRGKIFYDFVRTFWPSIREKAVERVSSGKSHEGASLQGMLGLKDGSLGVDDFARMQTLSEMARGEIDPEQAATRLRELDSEFPWSPTHLRNGS